LLVVGVLGAAVEAAKRIGFSPAMVTQIELGERQPSLPTAIRLLEWIAEGGLLRGAAGARQTPRSTIVDGTKMARCEPVRGPPSPIPGILLSTSCED
jgi:DNA-binding XRE family transcriptional regulator